MSRAAISQWFRHHGIAPRPWVRHAACGDHQDLPWVADSRPGPDHYSQMAQICHQCPVIAECASYALQVEAGFYAGIWVPWKTSNDDADRQLIRRRARDDLRRIVEEQRKIAAEQGKVLA